MKKKPLFSIVIVNYNHGEFLEETIKSILSQNCDDFELIIVDGGSTDKSIDIIKKYSDRLGWWISEKDNGQSDAFNKGFNRAKGDYYFWVNADDLLLQNSIKIAKETIQNNPKALWFAANTIFFNQSGIISKCSYGMSWSRIAFKSAPIVVNGPTTIFHKSLFEKFKFDTKLNFTMDSDLWMRYYNAGVSYIRIKEYFWGFRIHENSKTSHAFHSRANEKFSKEQKMLLLKNNRKTNTIGSLIQLSVKLFTGVLPKSFFDTQLLKGKSIYVLYEKHN